jgi:hypothetical protein
MFAPQCLLACPFDAVPEGLVSEMQVSGLRAKKHCGLWLFVGIGGFVNYAIVSHNAFVERRGNDLTTCFANFMGFHIVKGFDVDSKTRRDVK